MFVNLKKSIIFYVGQQLYTFLEFISISVKPDFKETQFKKDPELHDRLKSVFVQSKDPEVYLTENIFTCL